jgi:hypothetical protein
MLGQIMAAIAVLAVVFATMPAPWSVVFSIELLGLALLVHIIAGYTSASSFRVDAWLFSCYPLLCLSSIFATWLTAWFALGHCPRPYLDDPKYISPLVDVPLLLAQALGFGLYPSPWICVVFVIADNVRSTRQGSKREAQTGPFLLVILPLVWCLTFVLLFCDPGQWVSWFID